MCFWVVMFDIPVFQLQLDLAASPQAINMFLHLNQMGLCGLGVTTILGNWGTVLYSREIIPFQLDRAINKFRREISILLD